MRLPSGALAVALWLLLAGLPTAGADHIPVEQFRKGCGFTEGDYEEGLYDCQGAIPSIQQPGFVPGDEADWLDDGDVVIGVSSNGTAKAYPISILNWHEIVNDRVDGTPIAVTYCPLCGSAIVFERSVGGQVLDLHVSGYLFRQDLVMIDEQTDSLWPQIEGEAARGPYHGTALDLYPSATMSWQDFEQRHPQTLVLERPHCEDGSTENRRSCHGPYQRDYGSYPYGDYRTSREVGISGSSRGDVRGLHPKATVLGVVSDGNAKAYPLSTISEEQVIHDKIEDRPLVVVWTGSDGAAYERAAEQRFRLEYNGTVLVDDGGQRWEPATGDRVDGNGSLVPLEGLDLFWFAWADHHPRTQVYTPNGTVNITHDPPKQAPGPGVLAGAGGLAVGSILAAGLRRSSETGGPGDG